MKEPFMKYYSKNRMFFIVGRGRSGTTLLTAILNIHPELVVPPEAIFILNLYNKYSKAHLNQKKIHSFYKDLWLERRIETWNLDHDKLKHELLSQKENTTFSDLCRIIYLNYAKNQGKSENVLLGDKNPHYSLFVNKLLDLFPEAKFIHMVRDYRDCILSYKAEKFDLNETAALAYRWRHYNYAILKQRKLAPEKFSLIRYEDLINRPEVELKKICTFLGVPFFPKMLEHNKYQNENKIFAWQKNIIKPLDKKNIEKWKSMMKKKDFEKADYICRKVGKLFGYRSQPVHKPVIMSLTVIWGIFCGYIMTMMEKFIFYLPLLLRSKLITYYRIITGSLEK